ncbi:unnamed protein product [Auanema sp. JU1783]|nr:unnamed protein product [Auanema sp. JU1783]
MSYNFPPQYLQLPPHLRVEHTDPDFAPIRMKNWSCLPFLRYGIFAANIVHLIVGAILMALGIYLRTDSRFRDFLSERYRQAVGEAFWEAPTLFMFSYIMIILGSFMILTSFFGCCGVTEGSRLLSIIYSISLLILITINISCIAYLSYKRDSIDVELSDALNYMVQHYYQGAGVVQEALDHLQLAFRCCGNAGCSDFRAFRQDPPRSCDLRCDGCHYRISIALRIGFSVAVLIFSGVILCEMAALCFSLYYVFRNRSDDANFIEDDFARRVPSPLRENRMDRLTRKNVERYKLQSLAYRG